MDRKNHQSIQSLMGFDLDGTLAPIESHPEKVKIPKPVQPLLLKLQKELPAHILILSGRSLKTLKGYFPRSSFYLAGNHGMELEGPGLKFIHPKAKAHAKQLQKIKKYLSPILKNYPGTWIEDKIFSFSVHYRALMKNRHAPFCRNVKTTLKKLPAFEKYSTFREGKAVLEIRPRFKWHKGELFLWLQKKLKMKAGRDFFFYAGDDKTDEDVFKILPRLQGMSLYVGPPNSHTHATYRVPSEPDLLIFLSTLIKNR